ncbi:MULTISPECIES: maleylacetoacetate isomerase [Caballeronia]|jgi:maleylpyruvate isomerase|uniref:Maleylacetoacetate isomerase n=1 Tax=Caballeronia zhejiangensis TaxID=871203 RepID=A0A656QUG0_9BURK|nr:MULTISPECIES: maleylacetoacetate isomerase [Caballeronia]EKS68867.1 maleylacetoacetate isomerase [Burkholderia sp. SJ98]KDR33030.1 maleylacetoacetate isomerase [Caballeronia zhejiangensis]MCI1042025.1 maleylacetoacetate isomerase [Caballeronia zhejiangensis]MDR5764052.1 maleylacetoacetate isomerase [Caballeronia sp. LZ028]MDR5785697.1 maleylacetoacetate isomerase [Caballeronia sp. LP003]
MKLYSYFRSSAAYRVRIALNLKGLDYEYEGVHLLRDGGQQLKPEYRAVNPDGIVPALVDGDDVLTQSLAIIEYLEETHPEPALLPKNPSDRAFVRSVAMQVACEIHPLDNLRVLKYLKHQVKVPDDVKDAWYRHWVEMGFTSLETRLAADRRVGALTFGDTPTVADLCIVPQVFNARRFGIDVSAYPTISRIADHASTIDAFARAAPAQQPDAE